MTQSDHQEIIVAKRGLGASLQDCAFSIAKAKWATESDISSAVARFLCNSINKFLSVNESMTETDGVQMGGDWLDRSHIL